MRSYASAYDAIATRRHVRALQAAIVARRRRQGLSSICGREVSKKVRCAADVCKSVVPREADRTVMRRCREPQRHELGTAVSVHNTVRQLEEVGGGWRSREDLFVSNLHMRHSQSAADWSYDLADALATHARKIIVEHRLRCSKKASCVERI